MSLIDRLLARAKRTPYSNIVIGDQLYMERYWLVPYLPGGSTTQEVGCGPSPHWWGRLLQRFGIAVRIHVIHRSDNDRYLHDHPWDFMTIILRGGYYEVQGAQDGFVACWHYPGTVLFRRATTFHRLVLEPGAKAVTLFITFRQRQGWGFLVDNRKVPWREFVTRKAA